MRIVEVSMRQFSGHYPLGRLPQHSIVVRDPPAVDKRKKIGAGGQPEDQTDSQTSRAPQEAHSASRVAPIYSPSWGWGSQEGPLHERIPVAAGRCPRRTRVTPGKR